MTNEMEIVSNKGDGNRPDRANALHGAFCCCGEPQTAKMDVGGGIGSGSYAVTPRVHCADWVWVVKCCHTHTVTRKPGSRDCSAQGFLLLRRTSDGSEHATGSFGPVPRTATCCYYMPGRQHLHRNTSSWASLLTASRAARGP